MNEEIRRHATPELAATVFKDGNNTCLYGVCHYCTPTDPVCANGDIMEGALILWLPSYLKLTKHRNPWQRTYKKNKFALWETDEHYCDKVGFIGHLLFQFSNQFYYFLRQLRETKTYNTQSSSRLLDLIDTAIFDFLMDNGDRHHYELAQDTFHNPAILLIDNGKSLGNPDTDHFDILAPLFQCCL